MANTVTNVSAGKPNATGSIYRAPLGTTLPTDASTALNEAFVCLGYASDDGVKNEHSTEDTIKAWGGDVVYTTKEDKFTFTLIESINADVLKAAHGSDNVTGAISTGITVAVNDKNEAPTSWVIEMLLNHDTLKRIVIPKGIVTEVGEIEYKDEDVIGYELTVVAGEDGSGNTHYEYIKTATAAAASTGSDTQTGQSGGGG